MLSWWTSRDAGTEFDFILSDAGRDLGNPDPDTGTELVFPAPEFAGADIF